MKAADSGSRAVETPLDGSCSPGLVVSVIDVHTTDVSDRTALMGESTVS